MGGETLRLTEEEIALFHQQGFLRVERLVDAEEVAWVREVYDRLFLERAGWDRGDQFDLAGTDAPEAKPRLPQLMNPASYASDLKQAVFRETARRLACQLLSGCRVRRRTCDLQACGGRCRDALASGRSLLGSGVRLRGDQHLNAPARGNPRKRLHAFHSGVAPGRSHAASLHRARCPHPRAGDRSCRPEAGGRLSAAGRRLHGPSLPDAALRRSEPQRRATSGLHPYLS